MGRVVRNALCGPDCTERKGAQRMEKHLQGVANGLALLSGEIRTQTQGFLSSRHTLHPYTSLTRWVFFFFLISILQIRKLRCRGVQ